MDKLSKLPNIGAVLTKKLIKAGIDSPAILKSLGSKEAFSQIRKMDDSACFSMLCALEGAIQEKRWHSLPVETKQDLKNFFHSSK